MLNRIRRKIKMSEKRSEESFDINLEKQAEEQIDQRTSTPVENDESHLIKKESEKSSDIITMKARILKLESELTDALKRENENLLRHKANEQNIQRSTQRDIEKAHKFALQKFAYDLLPVIDNLERALETVNKSEKGANPIIEGIELTLKSLLDTVNKFGIEVIESQCNFPFNPDIHQAVGVVESDMHEPNHITSIVCKGYTLNGRLLRPVMVKVSSKKTS